MQNHKKTTQEIKTSVFLGGRKIQRFFQHHNIYNPAWNLNKVSLDHIKKIIKENKLSSILEIGTYNALTAIDFSTVCEQVTTIEIDKIFIDIAKKNIEECKSKNITLIEGDAKTILTSLKDQNQTFDLIFIDAKKSEYKEYLIQSLKLIKKGFIFIDNTISHKDKLTNFFEYLKASKLSWKELNIGKGLVEIRV